MVKKIEEEKHLIEAATRARLRAYAPYSSFLVGAALRGGDGIIYTGCNVENLSYGLSICAERVAVCASVAHGMRDIQSMVIVTDSERPASPCGACRQFMAEFNAQMPILLCSVNGRIERHSLGELFPRAQTGILGRE